MSYEIIDTALESRARRAAKRAGYRLQKSRSRTFHMNDYGEFMIVDAESDCVVAGSRYDMSAEDVLSFFAG